MDRPAFSLMFTYSKTVVKKGASIGANATILCGVTVGCYAMIAAGAVVKTDVIDHAVVAGVPARQVGWACKCGTSLQVGRTYSKEQDDIVCGYCGNKYAIRDNRLRVVEER